LKKESKSEWKKFYALIQITEPPLSMMAVAFLLSLLQTGASLVIPWFTKEFIDEITAGTLEQSLIVILIAAFIIQVAASGLSIYLLEFIGHRIVANLRKHIWAKMLSLTIPFFDRTRSGETISRITNDTTIIMNLLSNHVVSFFSSIVAIVGAVVILFYLDWQMTVMMLVVVPFTFLIVIPIGRKMREIAKGMQDKMAELTGFFAAVLSEIRLVKAYNAEEKERKAGYEDIEKLFNFGLKEAKIHAILLPVMSITLTGLMVLIIGYGALRMTKGYISAGELVAFVLYLFQIIMPFSRIASFFTSVQKARGATERIITILEEQSETYHRVLPFKAGSYAINFNNVSFTYQREMVLHHVSFAIPPKKITAIVGPSGSGKTTIFSLIARFYEPNEGAITIDSLQLDSFHLDHWRSNLGYVSQENPLLAGTVRENICYGVKGEVSEEELRQAAEMANAHSFIQELPKGYDTEVGERGIKLSGGQRQRVAIARAFLRDPAFLLLDEATSNLDSSSERIVQKALDELMKDRTTVVIAHRLSTVMGADQIIVLEKGRITGMGTHEELLSTNILYHKLVQEQFLIMTPEE